LFSFPIIILFSAISIFTLSNLYDYFSFTQKLDEVEKSKNVVAMSEYLSDLKNIVDTNKNSKVSSISSLSLNSNLKFSNFIIKSKDLDPTSINLLSKLETKLTEYYKVNKLSANPSCIEILSNKDCSTLSSLGISTFDIKGNNINMNVSNSDLKDRIISFYNHNNAIKNKIKDLENLKTNPSSNRTLLKESLKLSRLNDMFDSYVLDNDFYNASKTNSLIANISRIHAMNNILKLDSSTTSTSEKALLLESFDKLENYSAPSSSFSSVSSTNSSEIKKELSSFSNSLKGFYE
jgi:hypothetical protein